MNKRIGKFRVSVEDIEKMLKNKMSYKLFFSKFIIVRCEYEYCSKSFMYQAYSELFEEVPLGINAPEYKIKLNGKSVEAIKIEYGKNTA